jgi:ribosomal protein S28E/S33
MSQKSVKFHIKSDDYFGTLATVISLVKQNIKKGEITKLNIKMLNNAEKDLIHLQNRYKVVKK